MRKGDHHRLRCRCGVECDAIWMAPTAGSWEPHGTTKIEILTCGLGQPLDDNGQPMSRRQVAGMWEQ